MSKYPIPLTLVLVLLTAVLAVWQFGTIKSTGIPLGPAARLPNAIAQIIRTQERYLPGLKRRVDGDRFRLDLLLISLATPTQEEMISLTRSQDRSASQPMTKILGADGDLIWVQAPELLAVNLKTKRVTRFKELQRANPQLHVFLNTARFEFTNQLVAVSPDWQQAYAFAADTLRANSCPPPSRGGWISSMSNQNPHGSLCSGGLLSPTDWFGTLAAQDLSSSFKPGFSLPREFPVNPKDQPRQLFRGRIETNEVRPRIAAMDRISEVSYRSAVILRETNDAALLRLGNPDSVLMLHRASTELTAPFVLARITPEGKPIWTADTAIGTLKQILPDTNLVALIGERPSISNKLPEPILVFVNTTTGATNTVSLWR